MLIAALAGLLMAGCQSADVSDALDVAGAAQSASAASVQAKEKLGSGPVSIAMLLPRSAAGEPGRDAGEFRDGAALAVKELGEGQIALTIYDTQGLATEANNRAIEAAAEGAKLIIGPVSNGEVGVVGAIPSTRRPPVLSLATNAAATAADVLAFVSDEIDSAAEVAAYAAASGKRNILAIVPPGFPARDADRLKKAVAARNAAFLGTVELSGASNEALKAQIARADAVLLLGDAPGAAAAAVRASGAMAGDAVFLGTSAWNKADHARPELDDALLAVPDQAELKQLAGRFQSSYGRPLSIEAAYGYDAVALAAGVARTLGATGLSATTLQAGSGFRGATGVFRFKPDGTVERQFSIYRLAAGAPVLLDAAPSSF